jgi:DNA repair exonuclease SbcCD nuclease subunit
VKHLIFADSHVHDFRQFSSGEGVENSRFQKTLQIIDNTREWCLTHDIRSAIHLGDVFHFRKAAQYPIYNATRDCFRRFVESGIKLRILKGNHDEVDKRGTTLTIHSFRDFVEVVDVNTFVDIDEGWPGDTVSHMAFVPFTHDTDSIHEYLTSLPDDCIVLGHWDVLGAEAGTVGWTAKKGLDRTDLARFKRVLLGHYHKRQELTERAHYVGAHTHQEMTEIDQPGWFVVLDDITGEAEWHDSGAPIFRVWKPIEQKPATPTDTLANSYVKVVADPSEKIDDLMRESGALAWVYAPEKKRRIQPLQRDKAIGAGTPRSELVEHYAKVHGPTVGLEMEKLTRIGKELLEE